MQRKGVEYALLHCNSTYPAPFKDVHLNYMDRLCELKCEIGYSGHERDIYISIVAVAKSAKIIEKHFTLDRDWREMITKLVFYLKNFSEWLKVSSGRTKFRQGDYGVVSRQYDESSYTVKIYICEL